MCLSFRCFSQIAAKRAPVCVVESISGPFAIKMPHRPSHSSAVQALVSERSSWRLSSVCCSSSSVSAVRVCVIRCRPAFSIVPPCAHDESLRSILCHKGYRSWSLLSVSRCETVKCGFVEDRQRLFNAAAGNYLDPSTWARQIILKATESWEKRQKGATEKAGSASKRKSSKRSPHGA